MYVVAPLWRGLQIDPRRRPLLAGLGAVLFGPPLACCPDAAAQAAGVDSTGAACDANCMPAVASNPAKLAEYIDYLGQQVSALQQAATTTAAAGTAASSVTDFLSQNAKPLAIGAAVFVGLLMLGGGGRRR